MKKYCNFCGTCQDKVKSLIAGPGVYICNECIDLLHEMIHTEKPGIMDENSNRIINNTEKKESL
jgi:ATP-dependent Clp protease ATP-binding subunit ClpX